MNAYEELFARDFKLPPPEFKVGEYVAYVTSWMEGVMLVEEIHSGAVHITQLKIGSYVYKGREIVIVNNKIAEDEHSGSTIIGSNNMHFSIQKSRIDELQNFLNTHPAINGKKYWIICAEQRIKFLSEGNVVIKIYEDEKEIELIYKGVDFTDFEDPSKAYVSHKDFLVGTWEFDNE